MNNYFNGRGLRTGVTVGEGNKLFVKELFAEMFASFADELEKNKQYTDAILNAHINAITNNAIADAWETAETDFRNTIIKYMK